LWTANEPDELSINRKSVNVPPMSIPTRTSDPAALASLTPSSSPLRRHPIFP
jgi:hypothetical protein